MKNGFKPEDISLTTDMHVDSAFFIKWLENRKIAYSKRSAAGKLKLHDNWFFIDYHMIRPYTVFSILDDGHENLSSTLYHVIYDSQSKTIRSVNSLVSLETPDGYGNSDSLLWENDLLVKYSRKLDSVKVLETTVTRYEIKNGNFVVKKPANKD